MGYFPATFTSSAGTVQFRRNASFSERALSRLQAQISSSGAVRLNPSSYGGQETFTLPFVCLSGTDVDNLTTFLLTNGLKNFTYWDVWGNSFDCRFAGGISVVPVAYDSFNVSIPLYVLAVLEIKIPEDVLTIDGSPLTIDGVEVTTNG